MSGQQLNFKLRPELRLDAKWLKMDIQKFLCRDGLADLWNEMIRDGEIVGTFSDGLINSAGVVAKKGIFVYLFTQITNVMIINSKILLNFF